MTYLLLHLLPNSLMLLPALMQASQLHWSVLNSSQQLSSQVNHYAQQLCLSGVKFAEKTLVQISIAG